MKLTHLPSAPSVDAATARSGPDQPLMTPRLIPSALQGEAVRLESSGSRQRGHQVSAFTLTEVMVAICCFSVLGLSLLGGLASGFRLIGASRENLRASKILQERMEAIRLYTWEQVNSNGFIPTTFTATYDPNDILSEETSFYTGHVGITSAPMTESYSNDHRLVTVTVSWHGSGTSQQRSQSTLISRYGLHNYYYP